MARLAVSLARTLPLVFLGGVMGGGLRLALDATLDTDGAPWDIIAINVVGSALLGVVVARSESQGFRWWFPGVGPGLLGGFTTFSAIAALQWETSLSAGVAALVLAGTMAASVAAAFGGWALGSIEAVAALATQPEDNAAAGGES